MKDMYDRLIRQALAEKERKAAEMAAQEAQWAASGRQYEDVYLPNRQKLLAYNITLDPAKYGLVQGGSEYQQMLHGAAAGTAPSAAHAMLQQGLAQSQQQAAASLAGQRGLSPGMAARIQAGTQAQMSGQAGQQAAMMRAQEMAAARQMLGGWLGGQQQSQQAYDLADMQQQAQQEQLRLAQQTSRTAFNQQNKNAGWNKFKDIMQLVGGLGQAGAQAYGAGG